MRAVTCQFCLKFGREAKPRAKRKRTSHAQYFTAPFRVDVYTRHHENAHPERWAEFQQLSTAEKSNYFENAINHDQRARARSLSVFKLHEHALPEDNADVYSVKIESVLRFKMVLGFVQKGASFRSASRFVDIAREVTKVTYLQGCSEGVCATYIRIIGASILQDINDVLRRCWAYSTALDVGHAQGTSYMDVRIRFCTSAEILVKVHVISPAVTHEQNVRNAVQYCVQGA
ncbi:hypothetical protein PsorP6_011965 [Peronosclerospora sorghi]|uniref:Uncharacterized protein n=1 Tax=Peronosclerospora sorghi TaxID=230839 RepID=A0ACC0WHX3_9STRA|nr:hypothetical protein PsorP6_011965 [Peronosclerospora sorghi]